MISVRVGIGLSSVSAFFSCDLSFLMVLVVPEYDTLISACSIARISASLLMRLILMPGKEKPPSASLMIFHFSVWNIGWPISTPTTSHWYFCSSEMMVSLKSALFSMA